MTAVAGSRETSPTELRHVPLRTDRVVDRRSPRRASTRVIVAVALGLAVLSTVFTWTGADAEAASPDASSTGGAPLAHQR
jgi:hypothetical protein